MKLILHCLGILGLFITLSIFPKNLKNFTNIYLFSFMGSSQEFFEEEFDSDMMIESVPQVFDLDPLLNRSKNLSLEDLIKRLLKFIISIASCSRW